MKRLVVIALLLLGASELYSQSLPPMPPTMTNEVFSPIVCTNVTESWVPTDNTIIFLSFTNTPTLPFALEISTDLEKWHILHIFTNNVPLRSLFYIAPPTQDVGFFRLRGKSYVIPSLPKKVVQDTRSLGFFNRHPRSFASELTNPVSAR